MMGIMSKERRDMKRERILHMLRRVIAIALIGLFYFDVQASASNSDVMNCGLWYDDNGYHINAHSR
jgi:hypothetical protein